MLGERQPLNGTKRWWCCPALWARVVTSVTGLAEGYDLGSISGAVDLLKDEMALSPNEIGTVIGILPFAVACGAPMGGIIADRLGRKPALCITYMLLIVAPLVFATAQGMIQLYLGRVILGVAIGAGFTCCTVFVSEVAPQNHRAKFVGLEDFFLVLGITVGYFFNALLAGIPNDWRWMIAIGAVLPSVALCIMVLPLIPESPRWTMLHGDRALAEDTLASVVGPDEAADMLRQWSSQEKHDGHVATWSEVLCAPEGHRRQALLAALGIAVFGICGGITITTNYAGMILASEMPKSTAYAWTVVFGVGRLFTLTISVFYGLDHFGRRPMLLCSTAGLAVCMVLLAIFYQWHFSIVPWKLLAFAGFGMAFSAGLGAAQFIYTAEVLDNAIRSKGMGFVMLVSRLLGGVVTMSFPPLSQQFGMAACFALLAFINIAGVLFTFMFLPETKGQALETMSSVFV